MPMPSWPGPMKELWSVWREIEGHATRPLTLALIAPQGPELSFWRDALLIGSRHPERLAMVEPGAAQIPEADLYLAMVMDSMGPLAREMTALSKLDPTRLLIGVVGVPDHRAAARQRELMQTWDLLPEQVEPLASLKDLAGPFARVLFDRFPDAVIPLSRQFPIFRQEAARQEMQATAKQNGLVGVLPLPGADMPVMTANQIKMVLRMAAMYDLPMTWDRLRELLAVVGGGFALRTVARQVVKIVPGPGWLMGGAIGYTGTLAMGRAALEYFRRTAPGQTVEEALAQPAVEEASPSGPTPAP